jgi:hypothetical protein
MNKNLLLLFVVYGLLAVSCGANKRYAKAPNRQPAPAKYGGFQQEFVSTNFDKKVEEKERIISRNASLTLTVKKPDTAVAVISRFVEATKGINSSVSSSYLVIKVKEEMLDSTLLFLKSLGKAESVRVSADDLSDQYYDVVMRLENAEKARKRYLELLDKAANVQEILLVEKELERLNKDIESMKAQVENFQTRDKYSTININLNEKVKPGIIGYVFIGLYEGVKWLFVRN